MLNSCHIVQPKKIRFSSYYSRNNITEFAENSILKKTSYKMDQTNIWAVPSVISKALLIVLRVIFKYLSK